ncbi:MAG TPA: hypothetical protein VGE18_01915 [Candidatus Paceibacterota bacterium]
MGNYRDYSFFLAPWHACRYPQFFGYTHQTPIYLTQIPKDFPLRGAVYFTIHEDEIEGLLPYEVEEYYYIQKETVLNTIQEGRKPALVLVPDSMHVRLSREFCAPSTPLERYKTHDYIFLRKDGEFLSQIYSNMLPPGMLNISPQQKPHPN